MPYPLSQRIAQPFAPSRREVVSNAEARRPVAPDLQLVSPGAQHHLEMLAERKAALERVAELQTQLLTAVEQFGKECELKLVAMIEVRDMRKRVRGALQDLRDQTDDAVFEILLRRIEEALDA